MLKTAHLDDPDISTAAAELVGNVRRLALAGQFSAAHAALTQLLQEGPWKIKAHGRLSGDVEHLFQVICLLAEQPCPKIGRQEAMSVEGVLAWGAEEGEQLIDSLAMQSRMQQRPAGEGWSESYFSQLQSIKDSKERMLAFGAFAVDAEFVLKARLSEGRPPKFLGMRIEDIEAELRDSETDQAASEIMRQLMGNDFLVNARTAMSGPVIADAARSIDIMRIVRVVEEHLRKTGDSATYLEYFVFEAAIVLLIRDGRISEAAECVRHLLSLGDEHLSTLVRMGVWPPMANAFRAGHFAAAVGVSAPTVADYLAMLQQRRRYAAPAKLKIRKGKTDSLESFAKIVEGYPPNGHELIEVPILDTGEVAYAHTFAQKDLDRTWQAARALVNETGRWPIATILSAGGGGTVKERIEWEELFSRFPFEEAPDCEDISPQGLISAVDAVDVDAFIARKRRDRDEAGTYPGPDSAIEYHLAATRQWCGHAPTAHEIRKARIDGQPLTTELAIERWLLQWETECGCTGDPASTRDSWYEAEEELLMLFLPTTQPWDALAFMSLFGTSDYGAQNYIAMGRQWHERFGAELVAHYGTMLQCFAMRPPQSIFEAFELAAEQYLMAPCTIDLSGKTLRHHAAGLVGHDRWFLHERP